LTPGLLRRQIEATNVEEDKRYGDNLIILSLDIAQFSLLAGLVGAAAVYSFACPIALPASCARFADSSSTG